MFKTASLPLQRIFFLMSWILALSLSMPLLTSCESSRTIVHELDEKEANEILNLLASRNISAAKVRYEDAGGGGAKVTLWNIVVPEAEALEAMSILSQNGLPRKRGQNLLNIFENTGLVPSEMTQQIRYQAGLNETLASVIRKMDGVLDAEVQISFPKEDPLNPGTQLQKATASVYVKYSSLLDDPNVHLATKIKSLVAAGVPNLDYDNVTVVLDRARFGNVDPTITPIREEKSFVNIWSVIVAQESVSRFRIIFFSFIVTILLALLALGWTLWKILPTMELFGGTQALFSLAPLEVKKETLKESSEEDKEQSEEEKEDGDREIDET